MILTTYPTLAVFNATTTNVSLSSVLEYGNVVTSHWLGNLFLVSLWFVLFLVTMSYKKLDGALIASGLTLLVGALGNMAAGFVSTEMVILNLAVFLVILVWKAFSHE